MQAQHLAFHSSSLGIDCRTGKAVSIQSGRVKAVCGNSPEGDTNIWSDFGEVLLSTSGAHSVVLPAEQEQPAQQQLRAVQLSPGAFSAG